MINTSFRFSFFGLLFLLLSYRLTAQAVQEPSSADHPEWSKPYPPFRIAGNLYYVGTYDLGCYLITTSKGNILINTGLASSAEQIKTNIESLGFRFSDTKLLLTTQAHFDHLGAMAAIKKMTGAKVWVNTPDGAVVDDGGASDYAFGSGVASFAPIKADSLLKNGDTIRLGDAVLVLLSHPGHTKGSCSYLVKTNDEKKTYAVLIANLPTIIVEKKFADVKEYPGIESDYQRTFSSLKNLRFDLWVASHASQFDLHSKRKPGDAYNPSIFSDKKNFYKAVADLEKQYEAHLKKK
ncbi:MAG: subclass B3 metallo-beta-lactamase [Chitinophagaceae bacterium]|nr:MAG: subclass B3 metallo-beta-lactamase [Chitinophagaceae bacterium]